MRKKSSKAYLFLIAALILLVSLSKPTADWLRSSTVGLLTPFWEMLGVIKDPVSRSKTDQELHALALENQRLREEIRRLRSVLAQEIAVFRSKLSPDETGLSLRQKHRLLAMRQFLEMYLEGVPAQVIYRSPESWNSSLWINVGEKDNLDANRIVIAKDSPVVVGSAIVGVIDAVETNRSRVRLITDSGLVPSVRAVRDDGEDRPFVEAIDKVLIGLELYPHWTRDEADLDITKHLLEQCRRSCQWKRGMGVSLAKGELHGSGKPLWRSAGRLLHGLGFNYDFSDEEGPARDLRTGKPIDGTEGEIALIKVGDLLVTTGMDGVFPPGLHAAEVVKILPLKEGDYFYELEAKPAVGELTDIREVTVLPPRT